MQEDIVDTLHSLGHNHAYATCNLCGRVFPPQMLITWDRDIAAGIWSEHAEICPECRRLLSLGEEPAFPIENEGDATAALGR